MEFPSYMKSAVSFNASIYNLFIIEIFDTPIAHHNLVFQLHPESKTIFNQLIHRVIHVLSIPAPEISKTYVHLQRVLRRPQILQISFVIETWESNHTILHEITKNLWYGICASELENEAAVSKGELQCVYLRIDGKADDECRLAVDIITETVCRFNPIINGQGGGGSNCDDDIGIVQVYNVNVMVDLKLTVEDSAHHFTFLYSLGNCLVRRIRTRTVIQII